MRFFAVTAEVVMGLILGIFLFAALRRIWPAADAPAVAVLMLVASVLLVLFGRPSGALMALRRKREMKGARVLVQSTWPEPAVRPPPPGGRFRHSARDPHGSSLDHLPRGIVPFSGCTHVRSRRRAVRNSRAHCT